MEDCENYSENKEDDSYEDKREDADDDGHEDKCEYKDDDGDTMTKVKNYPKIILKNIIVFSQLTVVLFSSTILSLYHYFTEPLS